MTVSGQPNSDFVHSGTGDDAQIDPEGQKVASPSRRSGDAQAVDENENHADAEVGSDSSLVKRHGYFLPHWSLSGSVYHVVFRLKDSLPQEVLEQFEEERRRLLKSAQNADLPEKEARRLNYLVSERVEKYLDVGHGECLMMDPGIAEIVENTMRHFDGQRYLLHAWAVMPNHVHSIVQPFSGFELSRIVHSWKSFTAHEINKKLGRKGRVWQKESFDHIVRNERSFSRAVEYVLDNPRKANLGNWKWVGSSCEWQA